MTRIVSRLRGAVLRVAYHRPTAILAGVALVLPAVGLWLVDARWESWLSDGASLVCFATGTALIAIGISGREPDWVDPENSG